MSPNEPTESPFEYVPFEHLYSRALRDVADRRLDELERKAAARALAFLLRERVVTELVASDVLAALYSSLDVAKVVRTLLLGVHSVPESEERMTMWTRRTAERALAAGYTSSFVSAMRVLVGLPDYDGAVPTSWQLALLHGSKAAEPHLRRRVFLVADEYARRFGRTSRWVVTVWARQMARGAEVTATSSAEHELSSSDD